MTETIPIQVLGVCTPQNTDGSMKISPPSLLYELDILERGARANWMPAPLARTAVLGRYERPLVETYRQTEMDSPDNRVFTRSIESTGAMTIPKEFTIDCNHGIEVAVANFSWDDELLFWGFADMLQCRDPVLYVSTRRDYKRICENLRWHSPRLDATRTAEQAVYVFWHNGVRKNGAVQGTHENVYFITVSPDRETTYTNRIAVSLTPKEAEAVLFGSPSEYPNRVTASIAVEEIS